MRKIRLVLFGIVVGLAITELVLSFVMPDLDFHFPPSRLSDAQFDRRAGEVRDGNGVRYAFDENGFRTIGALQPDAGVRTVLFIGDSFTQGFGVNETETFAVATCARLAAHGIEARCLNAGVNGFGTVHELRLLRKLLQRRDLAVDAVVFQTCPSNDLRDNWEDGGFGFEDEKLVEWDPPHIPLPVRMRGALLENSYLHRSRIAKLLANAWFDAMPRDDRSDPSTFALERRLLQEVVATTQARAIPIVMIVAAPSWDVGRASHEPHDEAARLNFVAATAQELNVPWIDSRKIAPKPELYIENDGHFSAAGNALIGEAVGDQLAPLLRR